MWLLCVPLESQPCHKPHHNPWVEQAVTGSPRADGEDCHLYSSEMGSSLSSTADVVGHLCSLSIWLGGAKSLEVTGTACSDASWPQGGL